MKTLALLIFVFLVVPGSGQLAWDGIPFSTRIEFATLLLFLVALVGKESRVVARNIAAVVSGHYLTRPLLIGLIILKFFTFAAAPFGSGFEACYRSLYHPLADPQACEKSYEGPFLRASGSDLGNVSRIDTTVDYGTNQFDWDLPFMNDYPRLGNLWLNRLPFQATYRTTLPSESESETLVPILSLGELSVTVSGKEVARSVNYDQLTMTVVPLNAEPADFVVNFRYRDDELDVPPDIPPPIRGPYARLKIGKPQDSADLLDISQILLAVSVDRSRESAPFEKLVITDRDDQTVPLQEDHTSDSAMKVGSGSGSLEFQVKFAAESMLRAPLTINAVRVGESESLGIIQTQDASWFQPNLVTASSLRPDVTLTSMLTTEPQLLDSWSPATRDDVSALLQIVLVAIDLGSLLVLIFFSVVLLRSVRGSGSVQALILALVTWLAVSPLYEQLPSWLGGGRELVIPYALICCLLIPLRRSIVRAPLPLLLPAASLLAHQKVSDHLFFNHLGEGQRWWGNLLYYWRDSDWFSAQGLGRQVFVSSSLQGGEDVFWLHIGSRYLAFLARFLLGENDILIGMISITLGFVAIWYLAARFASRHDGRLASLAAISVLFIGMIFIGDQLITAFGFLVSSEFPTWMTMFGLASVALSTTREFSTARAVALSGVTALMVQFRPNLFFVSLGFLSLLLSRMARGNREFFRRQVVWSLMVYGFVVSLSLLHNLYYGRQFVPFSGNASINYAFNWTDLLEQNGFSEAVGIVWAQVRTIMYWGVPDDPSYAIFFWGSQLMLGLVVILRLCTGVMHTRKSLVLLLPLTYIIPMLKFQYSSYYPRHIVAASLLCLVSAVLVWPTNTSKSTK